MRRLLKYALVVLLAVGVLGAATGYMRSTDERRAVLVALEALIPAGLPVYGVDATGADTYAKVLDAPARTCHCAHVTVGDNGAVVSFDGGTTDHVAVPADTSVVFEGLAITASAEVHGKNLTAGSNYTNLRVSVW